MPPVSNRPTSEQVMYVINQTFNFETWLEAEWNTWIRDTYVPAMLSHPDFVKSKVFKIISVENSGEVTMAVQFEVSTMVPIGAALDTFSVYNKRIKERFSDRVLFFTTLLKEVGNPVSPSTR